jgi:hypothetical protein
VGTQQGIVKPDHFNIGNAEVLFSILAMISPVKPLRMQSGLRRTQVFSVATPVTPFCLSFARAAKCGGAFFYHSMKRRNCPPFWSRAFTPTRFRVIMALTPLLL